VVTEADGGIMSERAPAAHEVLATRATVRPARTVVSGRVTAESRRRTSDTVVPVSTAAERIARNVLDERKALTRGGAPGTLVGIAHTRRPVDTSVTTSVSRGSSPQFGIQSRHATTCVYLWFY